MLFGCGPEEGSGDFLGKVFPVGDTEVVDGLVDGSREISVGWQKFRVNAELFCGLFGDPVDCFISRNTVMCLGA